MSVEPDDQDPGASVGDGDPENTRERIAERIHFLFRQTGKNPPAVELEQQIMTYRLMEKPQ